MKYDSDMHQRRSIRLKKYDYSSNGAYFVTVCVHGRACLFGEVSDGEMRLNEAGRLVSDGWLNLAVTFPGVALDEYVVMPNHFHGIVVIHDVGAIHESPDDVRAIHGTGAIHELPDFVRRGEPCVRPGR